ncbi:MAG TPA: glycosyltransferase [Bryobacteraceae bacterium]|nr:glycosyltransferase [Bryobacteraceae bacterium]
MSTIAIGIHVHSEPGQLRATIDSVRACTQQPYALLLLPDGADLETTEALAEYPEIRQLATAEPRGAAACFNRLARNTESEIVVLLESGVLPGPNWLVHLVAALESDPHCGLAGPSTNHSWNEQGVFPNAASDRAAIARTAQEALRRYGTIRRTLKPLYSLADFCYAVRREVFAAIGEADEGYGLGPCWEMDYNIRAARAGFSDVWAGASYVHRSSVTQRRRQQEALRFEANKRRYQDKFCGLRLQGLKTDYRSHCRGDACPNFAPPALVLPAPISNKPPAAAPLTSPAGNPPLVSCIMPTYNRREFVTGAIGCFLKQDYHDLELIIVDDGSDPVGDLIPADGRVRYFRLPRKLTIGAKRNYACEQATGEFIVHWDDDDWYPADRVRRQVEAMRHTGADLSGSSRLYYREAGSGRAFLYQYDGGSRAWVAGNTLAYRRSFWQRHRFPDIQVAEDSRFIWSAPRSSVHDLKDPALCVASIHSANACPKSTSGPYWTPYSAEEIRNLTGAASDVPAAVSYPLISCVMPTYNRRPFIQLALECFRAQTYPHKELVVVDDGTDSVADLLGNAPDVHYRRLGRRLTIGAKRNLACHEAKGEIIAHWDDDDWYAPNRLELQVAPLLAGTADITGLVNRFVLELPRGQFWTSADALHRRMFVGDVHGGTLLYSKSILKDNIRYPEVNLAEDAILIQQAIRREKRLVRVENAGTFVYLRHGKNAWKFEAGRYLDPDSWLPTSAPAGFSTDVFNLYSEAARKLNAVLP